MRLVVCLWQQSKQTLRVSLGEEAASLTSPPDYRLFLQDPYIDPLILGQSVRVCVSNMSITHSGCIV